MLLNLQTLSLRSRDQDSDDEDEDFDDAHGLEEEDEGWKSDVDREIYVDGMRVGYIKAVVIRRDGIGGSECTLSVLGRELQARRRRL